MDEKERRVGEGKCFEGFGEVRYLSKLLILNSPKLDEVEISIPLILSFYKDRKSVV